MSEAAVVYTCAEDGEVVRTDVRPDITVTEEGNVLWFPASLYTRTQARQWMMSETGCAFIEIRATVEWLHCVDRYEEARKVRDWADEMWFACQPTDEGAHKFWRCEEIAS